MKYIKNDIERGQKTFLPDNVEDMVSEKNPVRIIEAFVDGLDIKELGFIRAIPKETGRPGYDPRDLLKLYIYGYFNRIRSSRKLMIECTRNIELFYLMNKLTPDFRTIADFRKDNKNCIKKVFREFVKICMSISLYEKELLAIDGTKIRAVNSRMNAYNKETLRKKLIRIDNHLTEYLNDMDKADENESGEKEYTKEEITAIIETLKSRKDKYEGFLKELNETGETQKLTTDPEARLMRGKDGFHCAYNVQTAVDGGSHLIAEYEVTNSCTDQGLLRQVAEQTKETLEADTLEVVADKGYDSRKDVLKCIENGIVPNVALKYDKEERIYNIKYKEAEITDKIQNSTKSEDVKKCISAGALPRCYENTAISLEIQEQNEISCFILNDDGTATCPMGHMMKKAKTKKHGTIYINKDACRQCPNRCTGGVTHKEVSFGPNTKYVPVRMYGNSKYEFQKLPIGISQNTPFNSFDRKDLIKKKVVLRIKQDKEKIKQRMCLSEHPFGTVKWNHGAHYLLCRGKEKATAELGLSFLVYNMIRAINIAGFDRLMGAIQG